MWVECCKVGVFCRGFWFVRGVGSWDVYGLLGVGIGKSRNF